MVTVVVVDRSAESRNRLVEHFKSILAAGSEEFHFAPRVSLKPLTPEELKFHNPPDLCVIGSELGRTSTHDIPLIRRQYPNATLLVSLPYSEITLSSIEHLARLGADDVISADITAREFLQKLIMLSRKVTPSHHGTLVLVHSGKGGAGTTSIAAGMAEELVNEGKRVVLVDFDFETQDLSRFLHARPFLNENLQLLMDQSVPITEETVKECLVQVWADDPNLLIMPPFLETRELYEESARVIRLLLVIFEHLDTLSDCVIVDAGSATGALIEMLYRIADRIVYTVTHDPAALYASVDRLGKLRHFMGGSAELFLVENRTTPVGLPGGLLIEEFNRASGLSPESWAKGAIPFCRRSSQWPGSGKTLASHGTAGVKAAIRRVLEKTGLIPQSEAEASLERWSSIASIVSAINSMSSKLTERFGGRSITAEVPKKAIDSAHPGQKALPDPTVGARSEISIPPLVSTATIS